MKTMGTLFAVVASALIGAWISPTLKRVSMQPSSCRSTSTGITASNGGTALIR
jgi:hypothetical protein